MVSRLFLKLTVASPQKLSCATPGGQERPLVRGEALASGSGCDARSMPAAKKEPPLLEH